MIPVKLKMRNFMCYAGDIPPVFFSGIHVACISGNNGNGKSALVDAMTWALWGRTRAKSDDDLVHSGRMETEVEFDFTVDKQQYRIVRKHRRPKTRRGVGLSSLDLLVASGDGFKVISGDRIKQTQQQLIDILHMDYDTFVNSALLRQGDADQFTKQTPVKRKEVLASILGLDYYDELESRAKDQVREQETESAQFENAIRDIDDELARKQDYEVELAGLKSELAVMDERLREQELKLNKLRQEKEIRETKKQQLEQLAAHIQQTEKDLERWGGQVKQSCTRLEVYEDVMSRRTSIEGNYARLGQVKKLNGELELKLRLVMALNERRYVLDVSIVKAKEQLLNKHSLLQDKIEELETTVKGLPPLKDDLRQTQSRLNILAEDEEPLRQKRYAGQQLQGRVGRLASDIARLESEIAEIQEKIQLLLTQDNTACPLCETELGTDRLKLIESKYEAGRRAKSESLEKYRKEMASARQELKTLEEAVSMLEKKLIQDRAGEEGKTGYLLRQIAEAEAAVPRLGEARQLLDDIEASLSRKDYAAAEQEALLEIEKEVAALGYDGRQHEEVRSHLADLERYEAPKRSLEEADRLYNQEKEALTYAEKARRELLESLEADNGKLKELTAETSLLPQLMADLALAETEHGNLVTERKKTEEMLWTVKARLERCWELEEKKKNKEGQLSEASRLGKIYGDLAEAFGKRGVQALLIERTIPEIEIEANKLLARMTDNRMHLKIETQRETKKGDVFETLDINISDELGMRNYEMFSGGEAFRINFSIRIALSRLLAMRAGARLPTLIIDEGFGTQDSDGISKLKEAINSIQDEFDKILVITHIDELKDAFPARIDVVKTAHGSTVEFG